MQPPLTRLREISVVTKSFLQSAGLQPVLSVYLNQPFHLKLLRHVLQLMQDPDIGLIDRAESGFHTGVFEPIRFFGIWRCEATEFSRRRPGHRVSSHPKDVDAKLVQEFHGDIAQAIRRGPKGVAGGRLGVAKFTAAWAAEMAISHERNISSELRLHVAYVSWLPRARTRV